MTEVKLMISELIPLFLSVVSSGEQTTHNIQFSAAHGSDMSERLFPTHIYFFTLWYETWWKDALLKLSLPLDFSAVSRYIGAGGTLWGTDIHTIEDYDLFLAGIM